MGQAPSASCGKKVYNIDPSSSPRMFISPTDTSVRGGYVIDDPLSIQVPTTFPTCVPTSVTHRDRSIHIERAIFLISDIFWPDWAIFESYWKQIFLIKEDQIFVWHFALFWKIHFVVKPSLAWYYSNIWSHLFQCLERLSGAKYSGQLILFI